MDMLSMKLRPAPHPVSDVMVYEYGARVDKDCLPVVLDQVHKSRRLYNDLVACIRSVVDELRVFVIEKAGPEAQALQTRIEALTDAFDASRAENDEDGMRTAAIERRALWTELAQLSKGARQAHKAEIQTRFFDRIGKRATCETYRLRCKAVADGLGWATANATLDAALMAFKKSFVRGQAPRFARADEKDQDSLTLQFTAAGGVPAATFLQGGHSELQLKPSGGCGRRAYGQFGFRLGAASAQSYVHGTWQYHRPLPDDASIGLARLIRRRIGRDYKWAVQLQVKTPRAEVTATEGRKPLVAVHFGWSADVSGRRIAAITDGSDPGLARLLQLPPQIELRLKSAAECESKRSQARDGVVAAFKSWDQWPQALTTIPDTAEVTPKDDAGEALAKAANEFQILRRLPATHVAPRRLHRFCALLRAASLEVPDWLEQWRKIDRLDWQASAHGARRARAARKTYYREVAKDLASRYSAILIEPLNLADAALVLDERTGERTDLARKARAGRVVAALYELESAIRQAAVKADCAVLELTGETTARCAYCGGSTKGDDTDGQVLHCADCGAVVDRKRNGAARAWQAGNEQLEEATEAFWQETLALRHAAEEKKRGKLAKMHAARVANRARTTIDGENTAGSRET